MRAGSPDRVNRRLANPRGRVVGYSRLMEAGAARMPRDQRAAADPLIAEHGAQGTTAARGSHLLQEHRRPPVAEPPFRKSLTQDGPEG